jgi:hypothetical protein
MQNLNRCEIANHLFTSVKEIHACERQSSATGTCRTNSGSSVENFSRNSRTTDNHVREDRSFSQSLWGRR